MRPDLLVKTTKMGPTSFSAEELDGGEGGDEAGAVAGGVVVGFASGFCGGSVETCDDSCVDSCVEALLAVRGVSAGPSQAAVMQIVATAHERIMH
jgi:hypothetical protein